MQHPKQLSDQSRFLDSLNVTELNSAQQYCVHIDVDPRKSTGLTCTRKSQITTGLAGQIKKTDHNEQFMLNACETPDGAHVVLKHVKKHKMGFREPESGEKVDVMIDFIKVAVCGAGVETISARGGNNEDLGEEDGITLGHDQRMQGGRRDVDQTTKMNNRRCIVKKVVYKCKWSPAHAIANDPTQLITGARQHDCTGKRSIFWTLAAMAV